MSNITKIDENEINEYKKLDEEPHDTLSGLEKYNKDLAEFIDEVFQPNDTSSAQAVLNALYYETSRIESLSQSLDAMMDNLIEKINDEILSKEDMIALNLENSISE